MIHTQTAFCFPGVGVALSGHELSFYQRHHDTMAPLFEEASRTPGRDLAALLSTEAVRPGDLATEQLFTFAFSTGMAKVVVNSGCHPDLVAGYSFGVYPALVATGAVTFETGLAMVTEAFACARRACQGRDLDMAAAVGLTGEDVSRLLADLGTTSLRIATTSNPTCHVVAGLREQILRFSEAATAAGAVSAEPLGLQIAYHHPELLRQATAEFAAVLDTLTIGPPSCPLVSSIDQKLLDDPSDIREFLAQNLSTPFSWERVAVSLRLQGIGQAIECGPGISLTQSNRFMAEGVPFVNVKNIQGRLGL